MHFLARFAPVLLALIFFACSDTPTGPDIPTIEETDFHTSLNVDLSEMTVTSSGLYYRDWEDGSGDQAQAGDSVSVRYSGYLANGTQFDSNVDHEDPFGLILSETSVIDGFDEGVTGMREGGERQVIIPPELGYGGQPVGVIPPHSILVFEIELEEIHE